MTSMIHARDENQDVARNSFSRPDARQDVARNSFSRPDARQDVARNSFSRPDARQGISRYKIISSRCISLEIIGNRTRISRIERISTDFSGRVMWAFCCDHDHEPRPKFTLLSVNIRFIREIRVLFPIMFINWLVHYINYDIVKKNFSANEQERSANARFGCQSKR